MRFVVAAAAGLAFGMAVERAGALSFGPPGWAASRLSAPWLVLPFAVAAAAAQSDVGAALMGWIATTCGWLGYVILLTAAAPLAAGALPTGFHEAATQTRWLLSGMVSGSLYGVLGYRWRRFHWWPSAAMAAGALAAEPAALVLAGRMTGPSLVYVAESVAGIGLAAAFVGTARRRTLVGMAQRKGGGAADPKVASEE